MREIVNSVQMLATLSASSKLSDALGPMEGRKEGAMNRCTVKKYIENVSVHKFFPGLTNMYLSSS
jgi:hypothetical protein